MSSAPRKQYTLEEYLALESKAETRHEFCHGEIYAMAGASLAHNSIALNIAAILRQQLKGSSCKPVMADMRLKIASAGIYTYPDIMVICEPWEQAIESGMESMLNPVVIVEVLSPSTEAYDRGGKFAAYRSIASLREYVLVSQFEPLVETFARLQDASWRYTAFNGLDDTCSLSSLDLSLRLRDVYDEVQFTPRLRLRENEGAV